MKIDSLYSGLKLLILGVILNYISGCTNLLDTTSPSYIKAYTHTEDLYIKKDDFLKVAKSKKVESYQDICSLLDLIDIILAICISLQGFQYRFQMG